MLQAIFAIILLAISLVIDLVVLICVVLPIAIIKLAWNIISAPFNYLINELV